MNKVKFDFNHIADLPAFYRQFSHEFSLDSEFGNNLDALWDAVTGGLNFRSKSILSILTVVKNAALLRWFCF